MRKNSPRKWLHAILDLLPVLILPIFALAVRSDNNFQPIEVQAEDYEVVDFNQYLQISNFNENFEVNTNSDGSITMVNNGGDLNAPILFTTIEFNIKMNDKYYFNCDLYPLRFFNRQINKEITFTNAISTAEENIDSIFYCYYLGVLSNGDSITFDNLFFNLTQMFGSGNEPTAQQVKSYYPLGHYEYTTSKIVLLNVGTTTLNDTDVGSQMVYTLYNATDKYFNFNNVFNFGQIYDWFVLNIFNGTAPLIFPVVWNIVLYEFIMDLVFLIYALFMFFIDFCTNIIDRFHVKCSGGK